LVLLFNVYTLSSTKLEIRAKQFSTWKRGGSGEEGGGGGREKVGGVEGEK
jgi:hypothetical protein